MLSKLLQHHEITETLFCRVFKIVNVSDKRNENGSNWRGHATGRKVTVASQSAAATATKFQLQLLVPLLLLLLQMELKLLVSAVAASLDFFMCDSCFMLQFSALVFISSAKFIAICQGACLECNSPHLVSCWVAQSGYRLISGNVRLFVVWLFSCSSVLLLLLPCLAFTRRQQKTFAFSRPLEMPLN